MKSKKPYLLRGIFDWAIDSNLTPHIMIDATVDGVVVPEEYIIDNKIVLNISSDSAEKLILEDDYIEFVAYFGAHSETKMEIYLPIDSVLAIYVSETGDGMTFENEKNKVTLAKRISTAAKKKMSIRKSLKADSTSSATKDGNKKEKPFLKIVKDD